MLSRNVKERRQWNKGLRARWSYRGPREIDRKIGLYLDGRKMTEAAFAREFTVRLNKWLERRTRQMKGTP